MAEDKNRNIGVTIGVTPSIVAEELQPKQRTEIFLCNNSTGGQVIYLGIDADAVVGSGLTLYPGGVFASSSDSGFSPTHKRITAISNLAGASLTGFERVGGFK